jgi:D-galactosamine 6-phosphate deaminase/isomerase
VDALSKLLILPDEEKIDRGLRYTPREIAQQPSLWMSTFQLFRERFAELKDFLQSAGIDQDSRNRPTVLLIGAGTSDYIGRSLVHLLRRQWQCDGHALSSTDLLTHLEHELIPGKQYLCVSFSRSGDSPEGVAVLERMLKLRPDIYQLVISCNVSGQMASAIKGKKNTLEFILEDAVNDCSLAMTSSFSSMVVLGQCLACFASTQHYEDILAMLVQAGKGFLGSASECARELASGSYTQACFVGSGPLRAVAQESALKLLEMTAGKIQTMSESALGLRHGPMAALNESTLFVSFLSSDERVRRYETDLLEEIGKKRLVRTRVVVTSGSNLDSGSLAERLLDPGIGVSIPDEYRPPVDVLFGQLLGLFFSIQSNLKPDCPSPNGAISRVVQNVYVYS